MMQSMHKPNSLGEWIDRHDPGHALARPFYTDPAFFEAELEAIWFNRWIFAGMSCELPDPGSWFTLEIAHASVIVSRDSAGALHAFHNTCRHRGSRICLKERGKSRNFVCPYHQWSYDGSGDLIFAREMDPEFDKKAHSLHPVHVREVAGYLFVSLAAQPSPFDDFAQSVGPYLAPHDLANAKVAFESTLIDKTNWKLLIENNRECYHCAAGHPELTRTIADVEDTNDPKCAPAYRERALRDQARWSEQGLPYRMARSENGWQIVRVPCSNGVSFTLSGEPASKRLMGSLPEFNVGSARMLHFPNTWNHALGDHAISFRVLPIDAKTTALRTQWLVHKDAVEGVDYDLKTLTEVWLATNLQDRALSEHNQQGIDSPAFVPGPYSPVAEGGVQAFIDWYLNEMREFTQRATPGKSRCSTGQD